MSEEKMSSKEYNFWSSAIKAANDMNNKEKAKDALKSIHMQLAAKYGYSDDVKALLKKFSYSI